MHFVLEEKSMASAIKPVVRIAPNNPVFDLPVIVGIEEGLFAKAGPRPVISRKTGASRRFIPEIREFVPASRAIGNSGITGPRT